MRLRGSLTGALSAHHPSLTLEVRAEAHRTLAAGERRWLDLGPRERCWIREVALTAGGVQLVQARTVVPQRSRRALRAVRALRRQPLARLLFTRPGAGLMDRAAAPLRPPRGGPPLPARRSLYRLHGEPLLVTEWLAPTLAREAPPMERYTVRHP